MELCIQQHDVLQRAMPAYRMQILTGQDNVDKWSELKVWEAALDQARVVVSTHAVLCDALRHGFVKLTSLALLVFDEGKHFLEIIRSVLNGLQHITVRRSILPTSS